MKKLKIVSLIYATVLEIACFSYFDTNPVRLILMGIFALLINYGLYIVYDYAMKHKILGTLAIFGCAGFSLLLMSIMINAGEGMYGLPFYVWILTSQESLDYTAYYTFAMFFLINIYISGLVYYATLNRYVLSVNFLVLLLPFASFARDDNMLHMLAAIPSLLMFFVTFIVCRQTLLSTVFPKEFKDKKISYSEKHRIELHRVRKDVGKKGLINISIITSVIFSACLLFPKPAYTADRTFFDAALDAQEFMDYLAKSFDIFTTVADPDIYKRNSSNNELFRVRADEMLRIKGRDYDKYDLEKGTWTNSFPFEYKTVLKNNTDVSYVDIYLNYRLYRPNSYLHLTLYNGYYDLKDEPFGAGYDEGYGVKYYSEDNVYDSETYDLLAYEITDSTEERYLKVRASDYVRETEYPYVMENYNPEKFDIPENIVRLAEKVTEGMDSDMLRAQAIERYLSENGGFTYDLDYQSSDINDFLFGAKRGVCYEFATAMTLMSRAVGIPARFATGFAAYQYDETEECFVIRERNAHAFPELYLLGYGWVSFEPTASIHEVQAPIVAASTDDKSGFSPTQSASIIFAFLVVFSILFYYLLLPVIKEKLFLRKLKKADPSVAYSLVFNRLRDIFNLPNSATLQDTLDIANLILPLNSLHISSVIYNSSPPNTKIISDYVAIRHAYGGR